MTDDALAADDVFASEDVFPAVSAPKIRPPLFPPLLFRRHLREAPTAQGYLERSAKGMDVGMLIAERYLLGRRVCEEGMARDDGKRCPSDGRFFQVR